MKKPSTITGFDLKPTPNFETPRTPTPVSTGHGLETFSQYGESSALREAASTIQGKNLLKADPAFPETQLVDESAWRAIRAAGPSVFESQARVEAIVLQHSKEKP